MRQAVAAIASAALIVLAGCGGSSTSATSSADAKHGARVTFKSPGVAGGMLLARYTCDGQNISPPMEWSGLPVNTRELVIFVLGITPEPGNTSSLSVEWALAGIDPTLQRIGAGELPDGAHAGGTGRKRHYSICPPKGKTKEYQFALYAVPTSYTVPAKFTDVELLTTLAGRESKTGAIAGSYFTANYKRK